MNKDFWAGRRVLVTGHTGFKGSWLCLKLSAAGARVSGIALEPPTSPSLFEIANVATVLESHAICDIRNQSAFAVAIEAANPEIIFHLAAQSLVRASYVNPVGTYATNVMGLVNLLEAARRIPALKALINITTDKCYENKEWAWPYRETDRLGGRDPYSNSKACAELVTAAYRDSFLQANGVAVATARAGNVIGGGDWAVDRLVPDFFRALDCGEKLEIRSPGAVRPWQHVLEPLAGYAALAEAMASQPENFADAWNFGPSDQDARPVSWIVEYLCARHSNASWQSIENDHSPEQYLLKVDSSKALTQLAWRPQWGLDDALDRVAAWHASWRAGKDMQAVCLSQIVEHDAS